MTKYTKHQKKYFKAIDKLIERGYLNTDGSPIECLLCGSSDLKTEPLSTNDAYGYTVLESNIYCGDCGYINAHQMEGRYEPYIPKLTRKVHKKLNKKVSRIKSDDNGELPF